MPSATSDRTTAHTSLRWRGSWPTVGSSRNRTRGARTKLAARSSRRRIPPEYLRAGSRGDVGEPEALEQLARPLPRRPAAQVVQAREHLEVLAAAQRVVDRVVLAGQSDRRPHRPRCRRDVVPRHPGAAAVGRRSVREDPDRGRLARRRSGRAARRPSPRAPRGPARRAPPCSHSACASPSATIANPTETTLLSTLYAQLGTAYAACQATDARTRRSRSPSSSSGVVTSDRRRARSRRSRCRRSSPRRSRSRTPTGSTPCRCAGSRSA